MWLTPYTSLHSQGTFPDDVWGIWSGHDSPCGIAIGTNNIIYVSEGGNHCVSVFNSNGQFMKSFGKFKCPHGLAVARKVCVCDSDCVQFFM